MRAWWPQRTHRNGSRSRLLLPTPATLSCAPRGIFRTRLIVIVGDDPAGARVGRVRDIVGVPLPASSRLVRRLQRRGLVHVERDPDDGRATRVRLTHAGWHTRPTILARRHHLIAEALGQTVPVR